MIGPLKLGLAVVIMYWLLRIFAYLTQKLTGCTLADSLLCAVLLVLSLIYVSSR